nr:immunoglobulin light chain junction region [Macaca mulatta]
DYYCVIWHDNAWVF